MKALITGASSGLGEQFLRIHSERGYDSVIVARSEEKLETLKKELEKKHKVKITVLAKDLTKTNAAKSLFEELTDESIEIVINNAGFALKSEFFESDISTQVDMIHLNIRALTEISWYFGKVFKNQNKGRILNIASIAAFLPGPNQPVYYASKSYVRSFSRAINYYLKDSNASVTVLNPGPTRTNFFDNAGVPEHKSGANPYEVALLGYDAMLNGRTEVTHGIVNSFLVHILTRFVPTSLLEKISANSGI